MRGIAGALGTLVMLAGPARAVPWTSAAGEPPGPRVTAPMPGAASAARLEFAAGPRRAAGYAQIPVPGDRLRADGVRAVELEARSEPAATFDVVLVTADRVWRAPVTLGTDWTRVRLGFEDFRPDGAEPESPLVPRFLRLEAPARGLERSVVVDVRGVSFPAGPRASPVAPVPAPVASGRRPRERRPFGGGVTVEQGRLRAEGEPWFPFGLFLLGGNRSLLERIGEAGANAVVEYGTVSWPLVTVEDHLDYARCAGVRVGVSLTEERAGAIRTSDRRLEPLAGHPALLAWYLFDEPDGGPRRGVDPVRCSPEVLRERRAGLAPGPAFVVCVSSFGLSRYVGTADILATDTYWPAMGRERSMAAVHSDAEALVEIAGRVDAAPVQVLQLAHEGWAHALQEPAPLRAQVLGSLAAGVRGILLFKGTEAIRLADAGGNGADLWPAFLGLASEVATWAPLAARWNRIPGEPRLSPVLGEVRASCFVLGTERWLVLVNLGAGPAEVVLGGAGLAGAVRLEDPADGWVGEVRDGTWKGRLGPWEGRVARIVTAAEPPGSRVRVTDRLPAPTAGRAILHYDRAVLGATLVPAPAGPFGISLDGRDLDDVVAHRGAALVLRRSVRDLAPGGHTVEVRWQEGGRLKTSQWAVLVRRTPIPFHDTFERESLGDGWGVVRDVVWNPRDPADRMAAGDVRIEDGELRVTSTGGSVGAVLRKLEAPVTFALGFRARLEKAGEVLVRRNELFVRVPLAAGVHDVVLREDDGRRTLEVDGTGAGTWTPRIDHRGGEIALGVPPGGEAWFDDVTVQVPQAGSTR